MERPFSRYGVNDSWQIPIVNEWASSHSQPCNLAKDKLMANWLFQSRPDRYDLREKIIIGKAATWYVTRYRDEMCQGDKVYFWLAGDPEIRGVYGCGELVGKPFKNPDWDAYGVKVRYSEKITPHISVDRILRDNVLKNMLILRAPSATNFKLSETEVKRLNILK